MELALSIIPSTKLTRMAVLFDAAADRD